MAARMARNKVATVHQAGPSRRHFHRRVLSTTASAGVKVDPRRTPRPENVQGDFFVDSTCIDCNTCRWMAPETFSRRNEMSAVHAQPTDHTGRVRAIQALLSCPTFSIHVKNRTADELHEAQHGLPAPIPGCPGVYHTGWHTEKSFAGIPYLIVRQGGNVLVDSPRFNPVLAKRMVELGGVKYFFLTHKDDIGDHEKWQKYFQCERIIHEYELGSRIPEAEITLKGEGPWTMGSEDLEFIFTPGHTRGHVCLLYKPSKALFTGDHLAKGSRDDKLYVFEGFNWYSVPEQLKSVQKLLQYDFMFLLPAHGEQMIFRDAPQRLRKISELLESHGFAAKVVA